MRISVKARYALVAVMTVARDFGSGKNVAVNHIAESLGISKIYLEQVFSQLKKNGLLLSEKGPQGGYQLAKSPSKTSVWEVLSALEPALVEQTESTVEENAPDMETTVRTSVFEPLDRAIQELLNGITIQHLLDADEKNRTEGAYMLNM